MNPFARTWQVAKAAVLTRLKAVVVNGFNSAEDLGRRVFTFALASWGAPGYERLARLAFRNPHANRGLRLIAQLMAAAPLYVERRKGSDWVAYEDGSRSEELALFDRPNPRMTRFPLFLAITAALHCGGELWIDKAGPTTGRNAGRARRLRLIMPDQFAEFIRDEAGEITGYRFNPRYRSWWGGTSYTRTVEECLHVRLFDPLDDERGLPILVAGQALSQMEKAAAWNETISEGAGRVPGWWRPVGLPEGRQLSAEQVETAQANLNEQSLKQSRKNLEMVLSGSFEHVQGNVTPKEADWLKGDQHSVRKIATLLGLSPALLGDEKGGSLTDAGVDSEVRAAYLLTVLPLLGWLLSELSPFLLGDGERFAVDTDQIAALQEDVNAVWKRYGEAVGVLVTVNEAREALGLERMEGEEFDELKKPAAPPVVPPPANTPPPVPEPDEDDDPAPIRSLRRLDEEDFRALVGLAA